jgi:hypothetical protein
MPLLACSASVDMRAWCGYDHHGVAGIDRPRCLACRSAAVGDQCLSGQVQGLLPGAHRLGPSRVPCVVHRARRGAAGRAARIWSGTSAGCRRPAGSNRRRGPLTTYADAVAAPQKTDARGATTEWVIPCVSLNARTSTAVSIHSCRSARCASSGPTAAKGQLDGWTSQWTRTHVCIMRSLGVAADVGAGRVLPHLCDRRSPLPVAGPSLSDSSEGWMNSASSVSSLDVPLGGSCLRGSARLQRVGCHGKNVCRRASTMHNSPMKVNGPPPQAIARATCRLAPLFEGHCGQQRSRQREKEKRRAVNQRGRYDNDRRLTRIRGNRADQAAGQPEQQESVTVTGSVSIRHSDSAAGRPNPPIAHLRM